MNELTYHFEGDYLIPDLIAPEAPKIGVWGHRRRKYLRKHKDALYTALFLSGKLNEHLEEIDRSANKLFDLLINQLSEREGITEKLKAQHQLVWVRKMYEIREAAEEIIYTELIYS